MNRETNALNLNNENTKIVIMLKKTVTVAIGDSWISKTLKSNIMLEKLKEH